MNKVILVGRLTKDPEIYYSKGENATAIARYNIAVDRKIRRESEPATDFIPCVLFGRSAEFAQKYFRKGMRIAISGRIQTGSYINKDGVKIHTTEIVIEEQEFAQSKAENHINSTSPENFSGSTDNIDENLPFN